MHITSLHACILLLFLLLSLSPKGISAPEARTRAAPSWVVLKNTGIDAGMHHALLSCAAVAGGAVVASASAAGVDDCCWLTAVLLLLAAGCCPRLPPLCRRPLLLYHLGIGLGLALRLRLSRCLAATLGLPMLSRQALAAATAAMAAFLDVVPDHVCVKERRHRPLSVLSRPVRRCVAEGTPLE